ncbi:hypothetical protein HYS30_02700, partial [Candidatus Peregrinibacteria bacterium]|nr:hypothetical protein [Candidatus Peregrinibacteria bacterium]
MRILRNRMVLIVCGIATLLLVGEFVRILAISFHALEWDALIFFTIGRGILNGLTPYVDLFESKPPGIFFLAIASLLLSKGDLFYRLLSVGGLVVLSIGPLIAYGKALPDRRLQPLRLAGGLLVLVLGMLATLYLQERAPGGQPEFFGSMFGALFTYSMATAEDRWSWP